MLLDRTHRNAKFSVPFFLIFISITVVIYEWNAFISERDGHLHHLIDQFSIPKFMPNTKTNTKTNTPTPQQQEAEVYAGEHREIFSASSKEGLYFFVDFVDSNSINPNIVPHPFFDGVWVIVAQRHAPESDFIMAFAELACNAAFQNGLLQCISASFVLPMELERVKEPKCEGDIVVLNLNTGPHDARVFWGPDGAYTTFGSNSKYTCFGQYIQNMAALHDDWANGTYENPNAKFLVATELQRPLPYGRVEKNWFLFWDSNGYMYVHYDVSPKRVFAKLEPGGSVGEDLALIAAEAGDEKCMAKHMPPLGVGKESIHQATNSLAVTMCKRNDSSCVPSDENTFILTIFQHKRFRYFHSIYEPYAMLFSQTTPFKLHGISTTPFWIHGRWRPNNITITGEEVKEEIVDGKLHASNQTEMMYITSINWKSGKQRYHGFIDDAVFLGFGIEDYQSAGIDVLVGDLLQDIGLCGVD